MKTSYIWYGFAILFGLAIYGIWFFVFAALGVLPMCFADDYAKTSNAPMWKKALAIFGSIVLCCVFVGIYFVFFYKK